MVCVPGAILDTPGQAVSDPRLAVDVRTAVSTSLQAPVQALPRQDPLSHMMASPASRSTAALSTSLRCCFFFFSFCHPLWSTPDCMALVWQAHRILMALVGLQGVGANMAATELLPKAWITEQWNQGYFITALAGNATKVMQLARSTRSHLMQRSHDAQLSL